MRDICLVQFLASQVQHSGLMIPLAVEHVAVSHAETFRFIEKRTKSAAAPHPKVKLFGKSDRFFLERADRTPRALTILSLILRLHRSGFGFGWGGFALETFGNLADFSQGLSDMINDAVCDVCYVQNAGEVQLHYAPASGFEFVLRFFERDKRDELFGVCFGWHGKNNGRARLASSPVLCYDKGLKGGNQLFRFLVNGVENTQRIGE